MRRGPKPEFVRNQDNHVINGLRIQRATTKSGIRIERYYALIDDGRRKYFGNSHDKAASLKRFRAWEAGSETTPACDLPANYSLRSGRQSQLQISSALLVDVGNLYLRDKKRQLTPKEWANSQTWWQEFCDIVAVRSLGDLSHELFRHYRGTIEQRCRDRKKSSVWVRSRFAKVKTIFNHALRESDLIREDRAVLELRSLLKLPPKPSPNPIDITPDELGSILRCADEWETALILTALNGAYYPIDCQRLLWSMIDFGKRTIRFDRSKTLGQRMQPVPRVAVLWRRTVSALDRIRNGSLHVFLSSTGSPVHIETIRKHWKRLCKTAGIERRLTFANLRDSALTAAAGSQTPPIPIHQYHILAGHVSRGVDDNYIRRNPRIVTLACEAIENRYFGNY